MKKKCDDLEDNLKYYQEPMSKAPSTLVTERDRFSQKDCNPVFAVENSKQYRYSITYNSKYKTKTLNLNQNDLIEESGFFQNSRGTNESIEKDKD